MKTVAYYLNYMADEHGVDGYSNLSTKILRQFKKYLSREVETWELMGDMDYLKHLGMYETKAPVTGTITANKGQYLVSLSSDAGFKAVGCELQVNDKIYTITSYYGSLLGVSMFSIFPSYMDDDTTTETFEVRYNRFPTPPHFKKLLNRKMIYLTSLTTRHQIEEIDFTRLPLDNDSSDPKFCQVKYSMREHGFVTEGTVANSTITVDAGSTAMTEDMVNMPVMFEGDDEVYHIINIDATGKSITIDRDVSEAISTMSDIIVLPKGTMLFELYPHPDEEKQIIYDYLATEVSKTGVSEIIEAPSSVLLAGLDIRLLKFSKTASTSSVESAKDTYKTAREETKAKNVTDYTPSVSFFNSKGAYFTDDYGRKKYPNRRNPYGRRYR